MNRPFFFALFAGKGECLPLTFPQLPVIYVDNLVD